MTPPCAAQLLRRWIRALSGETLGDDAGISDSSTAAPLAADSLRGCAPARDALANRSPTSRSFTTPAPTTGNHSATLGEITLLPHQLEGARRLRATIARHGGALLADEVGLGKTFTALHVARDAQDVLIVAPAALRSMWEDACTRARCSATITSYERVSAGSYPRDARWELVILDEAHHARSPATKRYAALCELTRGARVLLLTATPIHNRLADLQSLFALFLGTGAERLDSAALSALIVRRRERDLHQRLPSLDALLRHPVPHAEGVLPAIRSLPPPLPPADGGIAHALVRLQLTRAWCSSDAALLAAIRNRLSTATALELALSSGRLPSRRELSAWSAGSDGSVQLAFAELVAAPAASSARATALSIVREHAESLRRLRALVRGTAARDDARMAALARVLDARAERQAIVFTHSTATAELAFRSLRYAHRVALLTGRGACIASGPVSRADVLRQFAPHCSEAWRVGTPLAPAPRALTPRSRSARRADAASRDDLPLIAGQFDERTPGLALPNDVSRIDVLVASDVVSEGVDLQRAAVVVHLDLPWTVARLEQRIGRVRRLGSSHANVTSHLITPPVDAEELQLTLAHLSRKATIAGNAVGRSSILGDSHVWEGILPETPAIVPATVRHALVGALRSLESIARLPSECTRSECTRSERARSECTPSDRTRSECAPSERTRSERAPSERARSERARPERAPPIVLRWRLLANASQRVLALVALDGVPHLVCARDNEVLLDPAAVLAELNALVAFARTREPPTPNTRVPPTPDTRVPPTPDTRMPKATALESLVRDWCAERTAAGLLSLPDASNSPSHRRLLHAIDRVAAAAPRIRRAQVAAAAARARALVATQRGAGSERLLATLADSALTPRSTVDESLGWLARVEHSLQRVTEPSSWNSSASPPSRGAVLLGMLTILSVEESG